MSLRRATSLKKKSENDGGREAGGDGVERDISFPGARTGRMKRIPVR